MRYVLAVVGSILALLAVGAGGWFGRVVPFSEQWPMFEALRTTAAIIFAVIGAWLAIIYPDRLRLSYGSGSRTEKARPSGMGQLFTPVVNSTAILCIILLIGATAPIIRRYPLPLDPSVCRGISYGVLVAMTLWQLWTVVLTLIPASEIKGNVDAEDDRLRLLKNISSLGTVAKKDDVVPVDTYNN